MGAHDRSFAQLQLPFEDPATARLGPLTAHDELLRHFRDIQFERVRMLMPLAKSLRADALPRARRRVDELPSAEDLERWHRTFKIALVRPADDRVTRELVLVMMETLRGRHAPAATEIFVDAVRDARMSPQLVAGAVKRAWLTCRVRPSLPAFMQVLADHRREAQAALDQVVQTMGLRRDAERLVKAHGP